MRCYPMLQYESICYAFGAILIIRQKRQIYDRYGEEGLKAHEGGQTQQNPFDIFSSFFGGGCRSPTSASWLSCPYHYPVRAEQTRKGPSSVTEFELPLADMYVLYCYSYVC